MAIKKTLITLISGLALEAVLVWLSDFVMSWGLKRVNWRSLFVWAFFGAGFLSAWWLMLWTKLINRLTHKKDTPEPAPAVQTSVPTSPTPSTPVAAPQTPPTPPQNNAETPAQESQTQPVAPRPVPTPTMRVAPPKRMNVQNNAVLGINPSNAPQTPAPTETAAPISKPSQKESDIALLSDIDQDLDMMAFKHVALEGKIIDLVYSSDDVAVLCKLFSDPHTWTVDISQPVQDCVWTDETGATQRPCAILLAQKEALTKMEEEAQIIPTIVLMRGTIQNYQAVENYLLQNQISLVQYELQPGSEGKTLHDLLKEKFSIFSEDEEGEEEQEVDESENEADLAQDEEEDQEEIDTTSSPDEGIADENNDTQEVLQDDSENNT